MFLSQKKKREANRELEELRESEARSRLALEVANEAAWERYLWSDEMRVTSRYFTMLGYESNELSPSLETWKSLLHPDDRDLAIRKVADYALRPEGSYESEFRLRTKAGGWTWILSRGRIVEREADGSPRRILGVHIDITERKEAETERRRLEASVEQAAEAIVITNPLGDIQYVNPAFERITGYSRQEVMGKNPRFLKSGKQNASFYRQLWDTIGNGQIWHGLFVNRKKDGSFYSEKATISPVRDASGQIVNYVAVKQDVTHEIELEEHLRQTQKMEAVGRLAGGIAHDFSNMLTPILGYSQMALMSIGRDHPFFNSFTQIAEAAESAKRLTQQLLAFSRKQQMEMKVINLTEEIKAFQTILRRLIRENIAIKTHLDPAVPNILANPSQVEQLLMNLASNSSDAMPGGGTLTIETANVYLDNRYVSTHADLRVGRHVMLLISDTGFGMDKDTCSHVFEPFFTTKERGAGTGLGLATVYGIVKQHGGGISFDSEPGRGTVFRMYLPAAEGSPAVSGLSVSAESRARGNETVLVVEDEDLVRMLTQEILSAHGYQVVPAADPQEALRLAAECPGAIDLLLTDVVMPGMNGRELYLALAPSRPKLKVLYMSGYTDDVLAQQGIANGEIEFLPKPFSVETLTRTVRRLLDKG